MWNPRTQAADLARGRHRLFNSLGTPKVPRCRYRIALWALLAISLILGCARQYHWYRCGCDCVNYNYCPPAPLPYTPYCNCPTPIAHQYERQAAESDWAAPASGVLEEASPVDDSPGP